MEKVGGRDAVGALQSYEVIENRPFLLTASHQYAAQNGMGFSAAFCAITPQSFPVNNGGVKLVLGWVVAEGYSVCLAATGTEALEALSRHSITHGRHSQRNFHEIQRGKDLRRSEASSTRVSGIDLL